MMTRTSAAFAACILVPFGLCAAPPAFELVDKKERKIEVSVSAVTAAEVEGKRTDTGKAVTVPLASLAPENRKALESFAREHGLLDLYPELQVSVTVRDSTPRDKRSSFMRYNIMTPQMTLQGPRLEAVPAVKATVLTICQETKALYVEKKKIFAVQGKSSVTFPAVGTGEPRKQDFESITLKFDEDRDRSNTGGWIYKYWLSFLEDPSSGRIIRFDTSYPTLRKYLEANPEKVREFYGKGKGAPIPSKY